MRTRAKWAVTTACLLLTTLLIPSAAQGVDPGGGNTYTTSADFDLGTMVGLGHAVPDELRLTGQTSTFPFIWVANSSEGTISKLNTETGTELGRYRTAPANIGKNPSRTTVDLDGNVWVGNRDSNTITKVGLKEAGNCIDRNHNGAIDTSTGGTDVKAWPSGAAVGEDECILLHVTLGVASGSNNWVRAVAIDSDNNVFAGMSTGRNVYHVNGQTGAIIQTFIQPLSNNTASYGAVVAPDGALWISGDGNNAVVKHTFNPDGSWKEAKVIQLPGWSYGMAISGDYIWVSGWTNNNINKIRLSDGVIDHTYGVNGVYGLRGVAATADGDIWVASSYTNSVVRLHPDGTQVANITVGSEPTGVAVDNAGKVWATNLGSNNVSRINPATNSVDKTVNVGWGPYNYSDMTGAVVRNITEPQGTWTVIRDGGAPGSQWQDISWNGETPAGTAITARARSADAVTDLGAASWVPVQSGVAMTGVSGRYIQLEMKLTTQQNGLSPILHDVTINDTPCLAQPAVEWDITGGPGTYDIGFKRTTCGQPMLDKTASMRIRNAATNSLIVGYTYAAFITYDETQGEYHELFSPADFNLPSGTTVKILVYFGGKLGGTTTLTLP